MKRIFRHAYTVIAFPLCMILFFAYVLLFILGQLFLALSCLISLDSKSAKNEILEIIEFITN